ncbi:hypothetical protein Lfu02_67810 [Longispora fulva]|uniref:Tetratricopeptide (TPR) repeat protein n=1 Tax=Longispora fulva TaxID=619741 RepID=A0A8J7GNC4_9ACTN|nr:hypothetical protein [Longispora fulva]MBG6138485.1 tetratricopeptide (TPR) repeat protein [Longispora fulva]GIG62409.1 hypothetical protein Lfu02_67810 [Longispora fulva]
MSENVTTLEPSAGYLAGGEPVPHTPPGSPTIQRLLDEIATAVFLGRSDRLALLLHEVVPQVGPGSRRREGSLGQALGRLLQVERALRGVGEFTAARAGAWRTLSGTYSALGMHAKAMSAAHHASRVGLAAGLPEEANACLASRVRSAVAPDQCGDADGAVRDLRNLIAYARRFDDLTGPRDLAHLRYAVHRLAVLGCPVAVDVVPVKDGGDPVIRQLNALIGVCDALAGDRPDEAVRLLDTLPASPDVLGEAEALRLRALALHRAGDHDPALAAEHAAQRATRCHDQRLVDWLAAAVSATTERDWLRDTADHYGLQARAALASRRASSRVGG